MARVRLGHDRRSRQPSRRPSLVAVQQAELIIVAVDDFSLARN
jgi:hypothetical protein